MKAKSIPFQEAWILLGSFPSLFKLPKPWEFTTRKFTGRGSGEARQSHGLNVSVGTSADLRPDHLGSLLQGRF